MNSYNWQIDENYQIKTMPPEEFDPLMQKYGKEFFEDETQVFRFRDALSEGERHRLKKLGANIGEPLILSLDFFTKMNLLAGTTGDKTLTHLSICKTLECCLNIVARACIPNL